MGTIGNHVNGRLTIVVGLDFSEMSERALQVALNLARSSRGAALHLVHVVAPPVAGAELASVVDIRELTDTARKQLARMIDDKIAAEKLPHVTAQGHVIVGNPQREVPRVAEDVDADLIVIGTHGRRGLDRALFGSVAEHVVRYAPCSVLTVRPPTKSAAEMIEPPCAECAAVAQQTGGSETLCARHKPHRPSAHTYWEVPEGFAIGSMTFRF